MSRYIAEALTADDYLLKRQIAELERASGHPNHDLRLTSEVLTKLKNCLEYLGLDPVDTTHAELYHALNEKLKHDDQQLVKRIRTLAASQVNAEANVSDGLAILLKALDIHKSCFVVKTASLKRILRANPPKKAMKALNYRSVDSLVKYEPMALTILAINKYESKTYIDHFYLKYKSLTVSDFESRPLAVHQPKQAKWQKILSEVEKETGFKLISCIELGSIILVPQSNIPSEGQLTASLIELLSEVSKVLASSNYLRINQLSKDFANKVYLIAEHEPMVNVKVASEVMPWRYVQSIISDKLRDFELAIDTAEELTLQKLMEKLATVVEDFKFWQSSELLALVSKGQATSLNIQDVATNLAEKLSFESRKANNFRERLWQELVTRYAEPQLVAQELNIENSASNELETAEF